MIGFTFTYLSFQEILTLLDATIFWNIWVTIATIVSVSFLLVFMTFIVLPFILMMLEERNKNKKKQEKKKLLTQILLQKELENEVEAEIKLQEQTAKSA